MRFRVPLISACLAVLYATAGVARSEDVLHIESVQAYVLKGDESHLRVDVQLGKWPTFDLSETRRWTVEVAPADPDAGGWGRSTGLQVLQLVRPQNLVELRIDLPATCGACRVRVRFDGAAESTSETSMEKPKARGFYRPAKKKDDADIYFNGAIATSQDKTPNYSVDAVLGVSADAGAWGILGVRSTFAVDKQPELDPDALSVGGAYRKVVAMSPRAGMILRSDLYRYEFDRDDKVRNGVTSLLATIVTGRKYIDEHTYIGADPIVGFEFGRNYRQLDSAQDKKIGRFVAGANLFYGTVRHGKPDVVTIDAQYALRMLTSNEPFVASGQDTAVFDESRRHYFSLDANIAFTDYLGFTLGVRDGSLPPLYRQVRRKLTLGLTLKVQQRHRHEP